MLILSSKEISLAAEKIKAGELVCFPTETIYGLGADATNSEATNNIFKAKGRPNFNPLIAHVCDIEMAESLVHFNELAYKITQEFWPGPLTIILNKKEKSVCDEVTAGLNTLAIRMPKNDIALELIRQSAVPIAAPSANKSGEPSPTKADHIINTYHNNEISAIINGGQANVGVESTILDLTSEKPTILRHGGITKEILENFLGFEILESTVANKKGEVKSPGQLLRHYSPKISVRINSTEVKKDEALIAFGKTSLQGKRTINLSPSGSLEEAAHNLFAALIELDDDTLYSGIAVMPIPNKGIGIAINDKLSRANNQ